MFKAQHDRQLLQWLNNRPEDWSLSWGGATVIYGWGHNHRGQLGGLEGVYRLDIVEISQSFDIIE